MTDQPKFEATGSISSTSDQLTNVLLDGICGDIRFALKHGRNRSALILIFSGIDAMASLEKNDGKNDVRERFANWVNEYMQFGDWPEAGLELYGARCGILHTYGPISNLFEKGQVRLIGYTSGDGRDVIQSAELVLVSVEGLAFQFFRGIARYLESLLSEPTKRAKAAPRIQQMYQEFDLNTELAPSFEDVSVTTNK
jgi:hypothetical protein